MQHPEVERLAAQMHDPADIWQQVELVELLDDDGEVDHEKVAEAVAALGDSKPHLLKPPPKSPSFMQGRQAFIDRDSGTSRGQALRGR